ncbi:hypothetical protein QVD17_06183 [Tagetes erecta]|uniref:Uncharacterized protein n=1 Tax=Tagetes erecta TaxID=13708 RepID=A0AAD8PB44_TARER|nr:hypothetical protein QVD17_06183 [Tagetes erecta]
MSKSGIKFEILFLSPIHNINNSQSLFTHSHHLHTTPPLNCKPFFSNNLPQSRLRFTKSSIYNKTHIESLLNFVADWCQRN